MHDSEYTEVHDSYVTMTAPTNPYSFNLNSAATTNATSIKNKFGTVYSCVCSNINATDVYVKFYNKSSAPTVGTDVPVITIPINTNKILNFDFGVLGIHFTNGISVAITKNAADTDTTAVTANDVKLLVSYL